MIISLALLNVKATRPKDAEKTLLSMYPFRWQKSDESITAQLEAVLTNNEWPAALKSRFSNTVDNYSLDTIVKSYGENKDAIVYCCVQFLGTKVRYALHDIDWNARELDGGWRNDDFDYNSTEMAGLSEKQEITAKLKKSQLYRLNEGL